MQTLNRILKRGINIANRYTHSLTSNPTRLSLYDSPLSRTLTPADIERINQMDIHETFDFINNHAEFTKIYDEIAPCAITSMFNNRKLYFVYKANYLKEIKTVELFIVDADGLYREYVEIDEFVPITYSDAILFDRVRQPFMDFVDVDMVYKKAYDNKVYMFLKDGEWNAEAANLEELDFRSLFDEIKWIDHQMDKGAK